MHKSGLCSSSSEDLWCHLDCHKLPISSRTDQDLRAGTPRSSALTTISRLTASLQCYHSRLLPWRPKIPS